MTLAVLPDLCVDWKEVFLQLQREGYSTPAIEHFTGVKRSTFMGWKNLDAQPRHHDGERMIAFWSQATGRSRDQLPMKPITFSAARMARA